MKRYLLPAILFIALFSLITHNPSALRETIALGQPKNFSMMDIVDNVLEDVKYLSSFKSRVTGYPDFYSSAEYINKTFYGCGLAVEFQEYEVVVPIDHGTYVEILSPVSERAHIEAFTLWPNFIQTCKTPPQGIYGKLIYVGDGDLSDFEGEEVNGSIVLMDFDSMNNWLNAAKLGAKAVIFIEPSTTDRYQALSKFLLTPIYFPRLYVRMEDGSKLRDLAEHDAVIRITSNMTYDTVKAWNIVGMINGTEYPDDVIVISAHYDSWSVVPAVSHGLDETMGIASLLELARHFAENPPKRTLWFLALSGHWQALAGAREFTEEYLFSSQAANRRIWMQINLDLSADDKIVDLLCVGNLYRYGERQASIVSTIYNSILKKINEEYLPKEIVDFVNGLGLSQLNYWWNTQFDCFYMLDSEPFAITGLPAFTIRTSYSYRIYWGTPLDFTSMDSDNLKTQVEASLLIVQGFANEEELELIEPERMAVTGDFYHPSAKGFATLCGRVVSYNISRGWYSAVPHALVRAYIGPGMYSGGPLYRRNPFTNILTYADEYGNFSFHGLPPSVSLIEGWEINVDAWMVNKTDGVIEFTPDQGQYGWSTFRPAVKVLKHPTQTTATVMRSAGITLYDTIDIKTLRRFRIPDLRNEQRSFFNEQRVMIIPYDAYTRSIPIFYGTYLVPDEAVAMIFVNPNERFTILLRGGLISSYNIGFLVNADYEYPEGNGYVANNERLSFTVYEFAKDMILVSTSRYETLRRQFVRSLSADYLLKEARKHLNMSKTYLDNKQYDEAFQESYLAWALALGIYSGETMPLINDLSLVTLIFFVFLIPFVFFLERLLFHLDGKPRLMLNVALASLLLTSFYFVHPALNMMTNAMIGLLGVLLAIFFLITLFIVLDQTSGIMKVTAFRHLGFHRAETGRTGTLMISFSMALESMKRRRLRSALIYVTVIAVSFALTSLSSISYWTVVRSLDRHWKAPYNGVLLKRGDSVPPYDVLDRELEPFVKRIVEDKVGDKALVFPRVFLYPEAVYPLGSCTSIKGKNGSSIVKGILGLSPDETGRFEGVLLGRPFNDYDYWACIVPDSTSRILSVKSGDYIDWHGIKLLVVGVIADEFLTNYRDLDDALILPIDPRTVVEINIIQVASAQIRPHPQAAGVTLIVPVRLALALGGYVSSISVKFDDSVSSDAIISVAKEIAISVDVGIYTGWESSVKQYTRIRTFSALGLTESIILLLILGGANICSVMIGSIKERSRDISTFSSLGLSPSGVAFLFLTESMIYSVTGVVMGYLIGLVGNSAFSALSLLPSDFVLNFSSLYIIVAISIIVLACFASSLYPISIASKLVTPSLKRKWDIKTKPRGDLWTVPLPFALTREEEAYGCLEYIKEYFERSPSENFQTRQVSFGENKVKLIVALPPYEMNVTQEVKLVVEEAEKHYHFTVLLRKLTGPKSLWRLSNYGFIDALRKQMLLWRALPEEERKKYMKIVMERFR